MPQDTLKSRRGFMAMAGAAGAGLVVSASSRMTWAAAQQESKAVEVSPVEDLVREHGVLRRVLLIYAEVLRSMQTGNEFPAQVLPGSAAIIRRFVEDYHEKLEEDYLFPRFQKAGKLTDLVQTLYDQHQAGRQLTDVVMQFSAPSALSDEQSRRRLADAMTRFIRMYRPHAAREDTVLFPAVPSVVTPKEYDSLGEQFEDKEDELFGEGGFEKMVEKVASFEKALGIYDLAQFTPKT